MESTDFLVEARPPPLTGKLTQAHNGHWFLACESLELYVGLGPNQPSDERVSAVLERIAHARGSSFSYYEFVERVELMALLANDARLEREIERLKRDNTGLREERKQLKRNREGGL